MPSALRLPLSALLRAALALGLVSVLSAASPPPDHGPEATLAHRDAAVAATGHPHAAPDCAPGLDCQIVVMTVWRSPVRPVAPRPTPRAAFGRIDRRGRVVPFDLPPPRGRRATGHTPFDG